MYGSRTVRKRAPFHAPSISSETGDVQQSALPSFSVSSGPSSLGSKKSGAASIKSGRKSMAGSEMGEGLHREDKWLSLREYLLVLIEALLALTAYVIRERNLSPDELARTNRTVRQAQMDMDFMEGHSAWVSLVIGVLVDSYFRHYTMALLSVILHFATICIVFMEDTIKARQHDNRYAPLVYNVCTVCLILIESTDFTRLVYGLEGMSNTKKSTVCVFIFFQFWVSSYSTYGGVIVNFFTPLFTYYQVQLVVVAFISGGISLFLFVYFLHPETQRKEQRGLGCKVIGCVLLSLFYKIFRIKKRGKRAFLSNTEGTFSKAEISRTKELLLLYVLILPTFGLVMHVVQNVSFFYESIIRTIKTTKYVEMLGLIESARTVLATTMLISYFGLWPLMTLLGLGNKNTTKFLFGHLLTVGNAFYAASLTKTTEPLQYPYGSGFVRVFNTRYDEVNFLSEDRQFSTFPFTVPPKSGIMKSYPCSRPTLFAMRVVFNGTSSNYTMFLSVKPEETLGYMIIDPPEVINIRGPAIPLQEGPPGTNMYGWAKVFIYNTAKTLDGAPIFIKHAHQRKILREVVIGAGIMTTIALRPAVYDFGIQLADIKKTFTIEEGALYGMMIYSTSATREMEFDTVLGPSQASIWPFLGLYFMIGLANGISYPALRAIVHTTAPQGLMGLSFAFLSTLEGTALFFMYFGFKTWHYFVTGITLFAYAAGLGVFFFLCMFVMLKYRDHYG